MLINQAIKQETNLEDVMKKLLSILMAATLVGTMLAGCGGTESSSSTGEVTPSGDSSAAVTPKEIEKLKVGFVPSREPDEIVTATEPLKAMLTAELAKLGYNVGEVEVSVGTSYEAVGEALKAGTLDIGLIPGSTYVLYDDGAEVILTATRDALSKDSNNLEILRHITVINTARLRTCDKFSRII